MYICIISNGSSNKNIVPVSNIIYSNNSSSNGPGTPAGAAAAPRRPRRLKLILVTQITCYDY